MYQIPVIHNMFDISPDDPGYRIFNILNDAYIYKQYLGIWLSELYRTYCAYCLPIRVVVLDTDKHFIK